MKYKEFPNNPRKITNQALLQLGESLAEYGSLDGFVVNRANGKYKDCIVSGNQKNKHVSLNDAEIEIVERYDEPTTAGTLAVGHVKYKGERFPYREVSWSERKCEIANLRANNYGGENDRDLLLKFDAEILELGGVDMVFEDLKMSFEELAEPDNSLNSEAQEAGGEKPIKGSLSDRFGVPPFSVLNAREGEWQNRKRLWIQLGIKSELGRGEAAPGGSSRPAMNLVGGKTIRGDGAGRPIRAATATSYSSQSRLNALQRTGVSRAECFGTSGNVSEQSGTSIFDPVLSELMYKWFSKIGDSIIDPFAGGSVRGIVASKLGRVYTGVELRPEQVAANIIQSGDICADNAPNAPTWIIGDSRNIIDICGAAQYDMVFSCPPYADLEVYSDDPADLSTLPYPQFRDAYFEIIAKTCQLLKDDRFAVFVCGEVRGNDGIYHNFIGDTIRAFQDAGLKYYNEIILVTAVGSLPIRTGRQFDAGRKIGKTHQNILVFLKGDAKKATEHCGEIEGKFEFAEPESELDLREFA